jgi:ferredoxin
MQIHLHLPHEGKKILCHEGDNVRKVLVQHGVKLYRGIYRIINCRGNGFCGSCLVQIEPALHVAELERTPIERQKLEGKPGWRLACRIHAMRDLVVWTQPGKPAGAAYALESLDERLDRERQRAAEERAPREEKAGTAPPAPASPPPTARAD